MPGFSGEITGTAVWCPFKGGVRQWRFDIPSLPKNNPHMITSVIKVVTTIHHGALQRLNYIC